MPVPERECALHELLPCCQEAAWRCEGRPKGGGKKFAAGEFSLEAFRQVLKERLDERRLLSSTARLWLTGLDLPDFKIVENLGSDVYSIGYKYRLPKKK